jgi:hypothetical protein
MEASWHHSYQANKAPPLSWLTPATFKAAATFWPDNHSCDQNHPSLPPQARCNGSRCPPYHPNALSQMDVSYEHCENNRPVPRLGAHCIQALSASFGYALLLQGTEGANRRVVCCTCTADERWF